MVPIGEGSGKMVVNRDKPHQFHPSLDRGFCPHQSFGEGTSRATGDYGDDDPTPFSIWI